MLNDNTEIFDKMFSDTIESFEKIFGNGELKHKKEDYKIFVVTQMDSITCQDKIVKIKARNAEEAKDIFIKNQTIFAVSLDDWNNAQDMFIEETDGDFKEFLINSKKEINNNKTYCYDIKETDLFI